MNTDTYPANPYATLTPGISLRTVAAITALHAVALALLAMMDVVPLPTRISTLTVALLHPDAPVEKTPEPPRPTPIESKPRPLRQSKPTPQPLLAAETDPVAAVNEAPAAKEPPQPAPAAPPSVTQPRFDAEYLSNPAPSYPSLSRRMGEEGKVVLRVHVEPSGRPAQIEIKTSSGSPRLDNAAQEAVWRWKFVPARRGDETVSAWVLVPITFNLKN